MELTFLMSPIYTYTLESQVFCLRNEPAQQVGTS